MRQTTVQLRKRAGFDDVGHRLDLTTGAQISVCKVSSSKRETAESQEQSNNDLCQCFISHLPHELGHLLSTQQDRPQHEFTVWILEHAACGGGRLVGRSQATTVDYTDRVSVTAVAVTLSWVQYITISCSV